MKGPVLFISGRELGYIRNRVMLAALKRNFEVTVLTPGISGTVQRTISGLGRFIARRPEYRIFFAGFYGQPLAIALSMLQQKPIILDAYVSTYDTLCEDRRWFRPWSPMGRLAYWLDRRSCQVADSVVTDTEAHREYFSKTFAVPRSKITTIYVGCDETLFHPRDETRIGIGSERFEVFTYSAFLPLHGTDVIIRAAELLRDRPDIRFSIGGDGRGRAAAERMVAELGLTNIELKGWIPFEQLPEHIARSSICLGGHFSTVPKAARVISTKTFQFIAMRKPTIVGDNPATRELFVPGEHVCAIPMGSPETLADIIYILANDEGLRRRIASAGYEVFKQRLNTSVVGDQLASVVEEALCKSAC
jgi:glycosyltransferase involved in cell wall biosynthesis